MRYSGSRPGTYFTFLTFLNVILLYCTKCFLRTKYLRHAKVLEFRPTCFILFKFQFQDLFQAFLDIVPLCYVCQCRTLWALCLQQTSLSSEIVLWLDTNRGSPLLEMVYLNSSDGTCRIVEIQNKTALVDTREASSHNIVLPFPISFLVWHNSPLILISTPEKLFENGSLFPFSHNSSSCIFWHVKKDVSCLSYRMLVSITAAARDGLDLVHTFLTFLDVIISHSSIQYLFVSPLQIPSYPC